MPPWLPDLADTNGQWDDVVTRLYEIFRRGFVQARLMLDGVPVWHDRRTIDDPHQEGFWHLITKTGRDTGDRLLDPRRAERIGWCAAAIANAGDPAVTRFNYREGNKKLRTYLWLRDLDYVVILERVERGGRLRAWTLITAYYLEGASGRRGMERRFAQREP